jgi:hypothetical protein
VAALDTTDHGLCSLGRMQCSAHRLRSMSLRSISSAKHCLAFGPAPSRLFGFCKSTISCSVGKYAGVPPDKSLRKRPRSAISGWDEFLRIL